MISSKKGRLYFRLIAAAAVFAALASAIFTLADNPSAVPVPRVVSAANASTTNVTSAFAFAFAFTFTFVAGHIIGYSNFTISENGSQEENSTFKWYKRALYQPQNRSLVGYWKMDGNANGDGKEIA